MQHCATFYFECKMGAETSGRTKEGTEKSHVQDISAAQRAVIYLVLNLCFQSLIWMSAL